MEMSNLGFEQGYVQSSTCGLCAPALVGAEGVCGSPASCIHEACVEGTLRVLLTFRN